MRSILLSGALCLLAGAPLATIQEQEIGGFDVKGMPPGMVADARLTVRRCKGCHSMKRVLRARHRGTEWLPVVRRMAEKPKASMTAQEQKKISAFLAKYWDRQSWANTAKPAQPPAPLIEAEAPRKSPVEVAVPTEPRARVLGVLIAGGDAAFPRRRFALIDQIVVPIGIAPPSEMRLAGLPVVLRRSRAPTDGSLNVELRGEIEGQSFRTSLAAKSEGDAQTRPHVLKRWRIGRRSFRLVVAVRDLRRSADSERLEAGLALMVERRPRDPDPHPTLPATRSDLPVKGPPQPDGSTGR